AELHQRLIATVRSRLSGRAIGEFGRVLVGRGACLVKVANVPRVDLGTTEDVRRSIVCEQALERHVGFEVYDGRRLIRRSIVLGGGGQPAVLEVTYSPDAPDGSDPTAA